MSNLCTIIEFVQNLCLEKVEIGNMLKDIDEVSRENSKLENQLEEFDREHMRLQIELYNLETIICNKNISGIENIYNTSIKMYNDSIELRNLTKKIDFTKILQCYHIEIQEKCLKEWQPIQMCFAKTLNMQEAMDQRHIVQKYRQVDTMYRNIEAASKNQHDLMEKSFKHSLTLIQQGKEQINTLIVALINGSTDLTNFRTKMVKLNDYQNYIEGLKLEKVKLGGRLEKGYVKAFNPVLDLSSNHNITNSKPNNGTSNFVMPKLPSFTDILERFNQTETSNRNISFIQNTNKPCVKSILNTSSCKQSINNKPTKNVRFKLQLEEYQKEMCEKTVIYNNDTESETDIEIADLPTETTIEINEYTEEEENLQIMNYIEKNTEMDTVDLLTPANDLPEKVKENQENKNSSDYSSSDKTEIAKKNLIEIQDCIIFKTPFPIQELSKLPEKENVSNIAENVGLKQSIEVCSPKSSHSETSPAFNGFQTFFNDNKEFLSAFKTINAEVEANTALKSFKGNATSTSDVKDFLDFGSNKKFAFDSDDNMNDNYNVENMDFM